ncbi:MAG TPA: hypothetical protein VES20_15905 [Bryobacteraceae bacterium]|nr:hypothetical protein [Bryobacteraceae bacterium]
MIGEHSGVIVHGPVLYYAGFGPYTGTPRSAARTYIDNQIRCFTAHSMRSDHRDVQYSLTPHAHNYVRTGLKAGHGEVAGVANARLRATGPPGRNHFHPALSLRAAAKNGAADPYWRIGTAHGSRLKWDPNACVRLIHNNVPPF